MPETAEGPHCEIEHPEDCPRVGDTYAVAYAFMLLFYVPGVLALGRLPFRNYNLVYVSLVTLPFLLGLVLTFLTDSRDSLRTVAIRTLVLTPLSLVSGVAVMFTSSFLLVPINTFLGPEYRAVTTPIAGALLIALVAPLAIGIVRRVRSGFEPRAAFQALAMAAALVMAAIVVYLSVFEVGRLGEIARLGRKDMVIYTIGALVWYLPSFGVSAGVWRRLGLV